MAIDTRRCFWFGTEDRAGFISTPLKGADSSPSAWGVDGTLLNGGGYAFNSFGSHKRYTYEWPQSSSPEAAQLMKSYRDGTYGRGLLYFLEPGIYRTNILPAHWADPSMSLNNEAPSLVYGIDPVAVPTSGGDNLNLPITSAQYDLSTASPQTVPTPEGSVFIPVPTGHTLFLGAFYSASGTAGVFATPVNSNGTLGASVKLTEKSNSDTVVVEDRFDGDIKGVRLWVGRTSNLASTLTLTAMCGRLLETSDAVVYSPWVEQARNSVTNPSFETASGTVEVSRNYVTSPFGTLPLPGYAGYPTTAPAQEVIAGNAPFTGVSTLPVSGHPSSGLSLTIPAGAAVNGGVTLATALPAGDYVLSMYVNRRTGPSTTLQPAVRGVRGFGTARTFSFDVWTYVEEAFTVSAGEAPAVIGTRTTITDPVQSNFLIANMQISQSGRQRPQGSLVVSGAGTGYDPDMTTSFVGTANASPSVLTGIGVAGVSTSAGAVAIRSSQWSASGAYSLRVIPRSPTSTAEYAVLGAPGTARGTFVVTRRQADVITGSTWTAGFGRVYWNPAPQVFSDPAPNAAGETILRVYAAPFAGVSNIILPHGGLSGSGDVWYDLAAIFSGVNYAGPAFTGSTEDTSDLEQYRWLGGIDSSISVFETRTKSGSPVIQDALMAGPWIGGQGHSGCRFVGTPSYINNGPVDGGRVGYAATFAEVGSWVYG